MYHLILNQRRFVYTTCNVLRYVFCCLVCRKSKSLRNLKGGKRDFELDKGVEMLNRDLDVVSFLELTKYHHLIKQVLFNQDDRFLIKLQHRDLICTSSSEEELATSAIKGPSTSMKELFTHKELIENSGTFTTE